MNIENRVLQIENLSQTPFDDLLSLYRQGYRLAEQNIIEQNIIGQNVIGQNGLNIGLDIRNANGNNIRNLATCPSTVTTGGVLTLSATASSGTAPYTYHWTVTKPGGGIDTSLTGASNSYTFAQNGSYIVSVNVTDSCASGAKTSNTDSCTIVASTTGGGGPCGADICYKCSGTSCIQDNVSGTLTSCTPNPCTGGGDGTWQCDSSTKVCSQTGSGGYVNKASCDTACGGTGGGITDWLNKKTCLSSSLCIPNKGVAIGAGVLLLIILVK